MSKYNDIVRVLEGIEDAALRQLKEQVDREPPGGLPPVSPPPASSLTDTSLAEVLLFVREVRALGAVVVTVGDVTVRFEPTDGVRFLPGYKNNTTGDDVAGGGR